MDLLSQVEGRKAGSISNRELAVIESQALSAPRERPCGEASLTLVVLSSRHLFFMAPEAWLVTQQVSGRARPRSLLHPDYGCPIGSPRWCGWHSPGSCPGCQCGACISQGALSGFSASLDLSPIPNLLRSGKHCSWVLGFLSCPCSSLGLCGA